MFYFTYVLLSLRDKKYYIGHTDNIKLRLARHNDGRVLVTKDRRPLKLMYFEGCLNRLEAIKREKYFKTGFGRRFLKSRI
jgi:putative endonuclease